MARKRKPVWCVLANDGIWCAARVQSKKPDATYQVPTLCGMFVVLPHDVYKRRPTCPVCRKRLMKKEDH